MGASPRRGLPQTLGVAMTMMMVMTVVILMDTSKCTASGTILLKSNNTDIVAYQEYPEMEFLMDSESNQRILGQQTKVTLGTADKNNPVNCGRPTGSYKCGGPGSGSLPKNCRNPYDRVCPR